MEDDRRQPGELSPSHSPSREFASSTPEGGRLTFSPVSSAFPGQDSISVPPFLGDSNPSRDGEQSAFESAGAAASDFGFANSSSSSDALASESTDKFTALTAPFSSHTSSPLDTELLSPTSHSVVSSIVRDRSAGGPGLASESTVLLHEVDFMDAADTVFCSCPLKSQSRADFAAASNEPDLSSGEHKPPSVSSASTLTLNVTGMESSLLEVLPTVTAGRNRSPRAFEPVSSPVSPGSRSSPLGSPRRPRAQPVMPDVPPELAHLLESAICGDAKSLEDLRIVVSNEKGDSRSVVDALLATMGGVDGFDESSSRNSDDPPSIMFSPQAAVVAAKLIPWLPYEGDSKTSESPRSRMVRGLLAILDACTRNRAVCSSSGMLSALLESMGQIFEFDSWNGASLSQCVQVLAGYSLTVADLNQWLCLVKKTLNTDWAIQLMLTLENAMNSEEVRGPARSFEFDGESSGLLGPGESRWPFSNGFAFATWIYIESFADTLNTAATAAAIAAAAAAKSGKSSAMSAAAAATALAGEGTTHMPRLFSFISSDNLGFEAYFHGQFLVVESGGGKGRKASLHFTHAFMPKRWYFVGLEHVGKHGLMGKAESELRLYVDGHMFESRPFELPRISKSLAFSCIGTNPPPTMAGLQRRRRQCPLFAEVGPIYIFKESIGPETMSRLASRGGDSLPCFGSGAGSPWLGTSDYARTLAEESFAIDRVIEGSLHLLYHPSLLSDRFCPDASPSGAAGIHRKPSEVLGQVHVATRVRPSESLWALAYGGPIALLPLTVSHVKLDTLDPILDDHSSIATATIFVSILRIITIAIQHPGNKEELCRLWAPGILSKILYHMLQSISVMDIRKQVFFDDELVAAVISLCQSVKNDHSLKVHLFSALLLDLKAWSLCKYGLQKKLLSSLADMVFAETSAMRDANALQLLLDGCRRCYWVVREISSFNSFPAHGETRPVSEVNQLVDELMVVIELLIGAAPPSFSTVYMRCLISFLTECPQPNQVTSVLHLIYRLVVQPNTARAYVYAQSFICCGGIEALIFLLQRETKIDDNKLQGISKLIHVGHVAEKDLAVKTAVAEDNTKDDLKEEETKVEQKNLSVQKETDSHEELLNDLKNSSETDNERACTTDIVLSNSLGSIGLSSNSDSPNLNNLNGIDIGDGIVVGIIKLLGAMFSSNHVSFGENSTLAHLPSKTSNAEDKSVSGDKVSLLLFALQKALVADTQRLMTTNVYMALLCAAINISSFDVGLKLYDSSHCFEHIQLLLVLLRSLPHAPRTFQIRALQDLLFLACSNPESRRRLTSMEEWPEWILEVLISNFEVGLIRNLGGVSVDDIEDLIHNILVIMLEHSMRQKNGWMDVEAVIHCAEWLAMVGGSSTGDQRIRREESLPIFKRRLLSGLLDFAVRELQVQTQVIAAAAAGVAAEWLSPDKAKEEAEKVAHPSVALAENAVVILMIVEDHLRSQAQTYCATTCVVNRLSCVGATAGSTFETAGSRMSLSRNNGGGLPLDVLASMADENGQISAAVMERLTAAAAAEPYDSVRCAFISYGSCSLDLAEGWKYRSRLWYGVGLPLAPTAFTGGGSGWPLWKSAFEADSSGRWVDLPLVKQSVAVLQALLLDDSGLGGSLGIGGGLGTGLGGMAALYQLLDSDQPFLCMLRIVLAWMREDDCREDNTVCGSINHGSTERQNSNFMSARKPSSTLLWSVLSPILDMPISEAKRQRVLVASCILYSEVWHAVSKDRKILREQYIEAIIPPFTAILRRWRPLLAGIHEFTSPDGLNPLFVDDHALASDSMATEAALCLTSPGWAAAFASPPAAMALAMVAAGVGGESAKTVKASSYKYGPSFSERKTVSLNAFLGIPKSSDMSTTSSMPKDAASARAAALAAARDRDRFAKVGSGKGLSAVAMATSTQRRNEGDLERAKRWNSAEAMGSAWTHCMQSLDMKTLRKEYSSLQDKYCTILLESLGLVQDMQHMEMSRLSQVDALDQLHKFIGGRAWRKFIHCLVEMQRLFSPFGDYLSSQRVFWKLDFMEGSCRMRRCLRRDYHGSEHLGAAADYEEYFLHPKLDKSSGIGMANKSRDSSTAILPSTSSILMAEAISMDERNDMEVQIENDDPNNLANNQQMMLDSAQQFLNESDAETYAAPREPDMVQSISVVAPGHVPNEFNDKLVLELSSWMVRPLKVVRGTFQITTKRIIFIVHKHNNGSSALEARNLNCQNDKDRSWFISSLHQMYSRRYLLRRSALELFMVDRSNFFFDFGSIDACKSAYRAIVFARPPHLNNIYLATQRPHQLFKRTQLMERWARWEISNFEYIMQLNTMAGRSYNDITQYPVFPWILADYSSKMLDLTNPSSYRDLSKPIGALNPERLEKFCERYSTFEDPAIPKFHYGSHYSSAGSVLYYLVRLEPFTTLSIQLQGGKFDHADRMFSDIGGTWKCVLEDMSDVKELVPEMFYLPEILTNENSIDFGKTQLGEKIDSVKLPPWANNPVDFIHKHRMALESEYVSAHLHEWIDLIFGYEQRGNAAVEANNVFFYITYEGAVDIDKIADPVLQRATQDQIAYFGQTPSQLLTTPHLRRSPLCEVLHLQTIFRNPNEVRSYVVPNPERCNVPASCVFTSQDTIIVVDINAPAACIAMHKWQANTPDGQGTPFLFQHGKPFASSTGSAFMRMFRGSTGPTEDWQFPRAIAFAASGIQSSAIVGVTCSDEIITGGHADNSVKVVSADGARTIEIAVGHTAPVTCIALSVEGNYLVTGSRDTTVLLWKIYRMSPRPSRNSSDLSTTTAKTPSSPLASSNNSSSSSESCKKCRIEGPIHVLRGHLGVVTSCSVSSELGLVASCSSTNFILLHSLKRGRLMRKLIVNRADAVWLTSNGVIMTWNKLERMITTLTINGISVASVILSPFFGNISCMAISADGESAVIGTSLKPNQENGQLNFHSANTLATVEPSNGTTIPVPSVCFLNLHTLEIFHTMKLAEGQDITALSLNNDNTNLLVSTADKQLIVFTDPTLSLKVVDQMLRLGWEGDSLKPIMQ
ncbi:Guanine nucleotide-binding protein subunit beta-like protein [Apostasia shenzhenica]|uniref:Guanine nucleotide-binding protein subunit beta-like protein n=1 Tax=Apostasia shenzhenica TaxID=1088818 RepID=A0A2I0AR64_9ASPA|nr:Guanine nucleotide-binding protein subunit beta-like protein [Apostasia shenzhenica]